MDIELYNQEKGSGEPLILLHGNGEDRTYFENQMEFFQSGYRVIALDTMKDSLTHYVLCTRALHRLIHIHLQ